MPRIYVATWRRKIRAEKRDEGKGRKKKKSNNAK
jgi:hypothetical protein